MDTKRMLRYLAELEVNNDRAWYHAHARENKAVREDFEALVLSLLFELAQTEGPEILRNPKELIYRIPRDARMYKHLPPYNPSLRAHIGPAGKEPVPVGFYFRIQPGERSIFAAGLFTASLRDATLLIREAIDREGARFAQILAAPALRDFTLEGERLKNVPREYPADHPQGAYLKQKSWYLTCPVPDSTVADAEAFLARAVEAYKAVKPFNDFLNEALRSFRYPPDWQ